MFPEAGGDIKADDNVYAEVLSHCQPVFRKGENGLSACMRLRLMKRNDE